MGITQYYSNHIEYLADRLAVDLQKPTDIFIPQLIIIPNPYLAKWFKLRTAIQSGIVANLEFVTLNQGLWKLLCERIDPSENFQQMDDTSLQLLILTALLVNNNTLYSSGIESYITDNSETSPDLGRKIVSLAQQLSRYFMSYEFYRKDMILYWLQGKITTGTDLESFQREIFLSIFKKDGLRDKLYPSMLTLPELWRRVRNSLEMASDSSVGENESRQRCIYIFAESQMSPLHAEIIYNLGKFLDLHLYQVNPCAEFWEDVHTPREEKWTRIKAISKGISNQENLYLAGENQLLKLWGKAGRETVILLGLLEEKGSRDYCFISEWLNPPDQKQPETMLEHIQKKILFRETEPGPNLAPDPSIQIVRCTDIYREVEGAYNSIILNLQNDSGLETSDITVLVPDMELYLPVINSVFMKKPRYFDFSIIDSNAGSQSHFTSALLGLLGLISGTFSRNDIFKLLKNPCILSASGLTRDDLDIILQWIDSLNIFHGFEFNSQVNAYNNIFSWQKGLQRLRFGRIMKIPETTVENHFSFHFQDTSPLETDQTSDSNLVGSFCFLIESIYFRITRLKNSRMTGNAWAIEIKNLINEFIKIPSEHPEEENVYFSILDYLDHFSPKISIPQSDEITYDSSIVVSLLKDFISTISSSRGRFLTSGINVTALIPKRQIPFRIVYILGMREGLYPGNNDLSSLDLKNTYRMHGDLSRQDVDQYTFLETILSVRSKLYISYVYRDLQKDQEIFPSSVLSQFISYIENQFFGDKAFPIQSLPPSAISLEYLINPDEKSSYSDYYVWQSGADSQLGISSNWIRRILYQKYFHHTCQTQESQKYYNQFVKSSAISDLFDAEKNCDCIQDSINHVISINDLKQFLLNPIQATLHHDLQLFDYNFEDNTLKIEEPFFSPSRMKYKIISDTIKSFLANREDFDLQPYLRSYYNHAALKGEIPSGVFGEIDHDEKLTMLHNIIYAEKYGIAGFFDERKNLKFFRSLAIGHPNIKSSPAKRIPALLVRRSIIDQQIDIHINGIVENIWIDESTGNLEILSIHHAVKADISYILDSFLFYIIVRSRLFPQLSELININSCIIHVSLRNKIQSFKYHLSEENSKDYFESLIADFTGEERLDFIPLQIIANDNSLISICLKENIEEKDIPYFRDRLISLINSSEDSQFSNWKPSPLMEILQLIPPENCLLKARKRFAPIFKSFTGDQSI